MIKQRFFSDDKRENSLVFSKNALVKKSRLSGKAEEMAMLEEPREPFAWAIQEGENPGLITIYKMSYMKVGMYEMKWVFESKNIIHGQDGWQFVQPNENLKVNTSNLVEDLLVFLNENESDLPLEHIFQPDEEQQSELYKRVNKRTIKNPIDVINLSVNKEEDNNFKVKHSSYENEFFKGNKLSEDSFSSKQNDNSNSRAEKSIALPQAIADTLICKYTRKRMTQPITLMRGKKRGLTCDKSALKEVLSKLNSQKDKKEAVYTEADFTINYALNSIINNIDSISQNIAAKNWSKVEEFIEDPIHHELMKNSVLNPVGQTYDKKTLTDKMGKNKPEITQDYITRSEFEGPLTKKDLISNKPLQKFIDAYKDHKSKEEKKSMPRKRFF